MSSHRRTLAAAVASAAASVSLYPIFTGGVWFLAGLGAIAVVAAAGTATRWRRLPEPVCLAAGLVALLLYLNLAFAQQQVTAAPAADARLRPTTRAPGRPGVRRRGHVRSPSPRAGPDGAARGRRHRDRGPAHRLDGGPAWQRRAGGPAAAAAVHRAVHAQRRPRLLRHHGGVLRRHRRLSRPAQQRGQGPHPRVGIPGPVRPQRARHEGPGGGRAKGRLRLGRRRPDPAPGGAGIARHPAIRRRAAGDRRARRRRREQRRGGGRRVPRGGHAVLAAALVRADHAVADRARLHHRRHIPRLPPALRARQAHRFRVVAVQPAGSDGASRPAAAGAARAHGRRHWTAR